jgi:hypothetical protein
MPKASPRKSPKAPVRSRSTRKKAVRKAKETTPVMTYGLVSFSFQNVDYQIDLEKSKVYRRFVEVEKSRTNSIITAYRSGTVPPRITL